MTDGTISYAIFTYNCNEMQWSGQQKSEYAAVGINSDDLLYNHYASRRPDIHEAVSCSNLPREPWANEVFVIGRSSSPADRAMQQCLMRINEDVIQYPFAPQQFFTARFALSCPLVLIQALRDRRYRSLAQFQEYFASGQICFARTRFIVLFGLQLLTPSQICCYSTSSFL